MFFVGGIYTNPQSIPEAGVVIHVHARSDGELLGTAQTDSTGLFSVNGLQSQQPVYVMAVRDGLQALVFDNVIPVTEFFLSGENTRVVNLCDPIGEIGPLVGTGDFTGHTVRWEQIEGLAVELVGDDTFSPTFVNSPIGETRVFLAIIDEGTLFEQTQEYTVLGRPEEEYRVPNLIETNYPERRQDNARGSSSTNQVVNLRVEPSSPPDCTPIDSWELIWSPPPRVSEGLFLRYEVESFISGEWQVVDTIEDGQGLSSEMVEGVPYRVATVWLKGFNTQSTYRYVSPPLVTIGSRPGVIHAAGLSRARYTNAILGRISDLTVVIPTRAVKPVQDSDNLRYNLLIPMVNSIVRLQASTKQVNEDSYAFRVNNIIRDSVVINRSNGTSIGN